ncbi:YbaB/EbfC family nucleoid-associated protein [Microvirga sp. W0021]|uniref:Nucleoid-associated protein WJT86_03470 n=1 Tax=Hohaiivirga grylli TaxID=3133970 RepID=A0ABV0BGS5_9HYPH
MRDMMGLMKQAQAMQKKMQDMQAEIEQMTVEGTSGGGAVKVTLSVKGDMKGIAIDPTLMVPDEKEILEDLIVAAMADARTKAERIMQERMADVTGGLQLPPGMKLF